jgi:hypothetical protein
MISTVTTSTVSTVTTAALAGSVALVGIIVLLVLVVQKEFSGASQGGRFQRLEQALLIGIVPLVIAFVVVVTTRVIDSLR